MIIFIIREDGEYFILINNIPNSNDVLEYRWKPSKQSYHDIIMGSCAGRVITSTRKADTGTEKGSSPNRNITSMKIGKISKLSDIEYFVSLVNQANLRYGLFDYPHHFGVTSLLFCLSVLRYVGYGDNFRFKSLGIGHSRSTTPYREDLIQQKVDTENITDLGSLLEYISSRVCLCAVVEGGMQALESPTIIAPEFDNFGAVDDLIAFLKFQEGSPVIGESMASGDLSSDKNTTSYNVDYGNGVFYFDSEYPDIASGYTYSEDTGGQTIMVSEVITMEREIYDTDSTGTETEEQTKATEESKSVKRDDLITHDTTKYSSGNIYEDTESSMMTISHDDSSYDYHDVTLVMPEEGTQGRLKTKPSHNNEIDKPGEERECPSGDLTTEELPSIQLYFDEKMHAKGKGVRKETPEGQDEIRDFDKNSGPRKSPIVGRGFGYKANLKRKKRENILAKSEGIRRNYMTNRSKVSNSYKREYTKRPGTKFGRDILGTSFVSPLNGSESCSCQNALVENVQPQLIGSYSFIAYGGLLFFIIIFVGVLVFFFLRKDRK